VKPTERFSDRVEDYANHRPSYPMAVLDTIDEHAASCSLQRIAADVGSGTGLFTGGLLSHGWTVHAIEPNQKMRAVAERAFQAQSCFVSSAGTAEDTGLPSASVSVVAAAQAFHWFDPVQCRVEWGRILVPAGFVSLVWNVRRLGSPFMDDYESLLSSLLPEYRLVTHRHSVADDLRRFLTGGAQTRSIPHHQTFDWNGFVGRVMSSSYVPKPDAPLHQPLFARLRDLFNEHQRAMSRPLLKFGGGSVEILRDVHR
jgi:SAM-dependent methyltransferase